MVVDLILKVDWSYHRTFMCDALIFVLQATEMLHSELCPLNQMIAFIKRPFAFKAMGQNGRI